MSNKKLKHIEVYNQLYNKIQDGTFAPGSQLPSETVLSTQMGVSRMTLRKALALLQDDGLAKNVQGVGHFITSPGDNNVKKETTDNVVINPVYDYFTDAVICDKFEFRIEPPTKSISDSLSQYTAAVIIADRWYKSDNSYTAYSLSIIPIEVIGRKEIDLNKPEQLLEYIETGCYKEQKICKRTLTHSSSGNFTAKDYSLSEKDSFLLIQENIFNKDNRIIISNKHFIPFDKFKIEINL